MAKETETIYSGAADFGRFIVNISAIVLLAVAAIMALTGVYAIFFRSASKPLVENSTLTNKQLGIRMLLTSTVLFLLTVITLWLSQKYKFFSAAVGAGEALAIIL